MPIDRWENINSWLKTAGAKAPVLLSAATDEELKAAALKVIELAACEKEKPCGACRGCRLAKNNTHPDMIYFEPPEKTITIKNIREVLDKLSRTASGERRVVVILRAEALSLPAANALLKALEEPASSTRYVLATRWPKRLLPTILSRCMPVRLPAGARAEPASAPDWLSLTERLGGKETPAPEVLRGIARKLEEDLKEKGPTPELKRALMRLRDYYVITAQRGNERLARDVLWMTVCKVK